MANICDAELRIKGLKSNVLDFLKFFDKKTKCWFLRSEVRYAPDLSKINSDKEISISISVQCDWGLHFCFTHYRTNTHFFNGKIEIRKIGRTYGIVDVPVNIPPTLISLNENTLNDLRLGKYAEIASKYNAGYSPNDVIFIDLTTACKLCNVDVEAISEEEMDNVTEHLYVDRSGEMHIEDCEYLIDEKDLDDILKYEGKEYDEKWNKLYDEACNRIYSNWKFINDSVIFE